MPYFVYVIKSLSHGTRYIGIAHDLGRRMVEHNTGRCRYTSGRKPWKLIYYETAVSLGAARKRENFLKSGQGRKFLTNAILS